MAKSPKKSTLSGGINYADKGGKLTLPSNWHVLDDDKVTISKARLESLKDMAEDDRMDAPSWTFHRATGTVGCGLFFVGIGGLLNYSQLDIIAATCYFIAALFGILLAVYGYASEWLDSGKRVSYREKLCGKIDRILSEVEMLKAAKKTE